MYQSVIITGAAGMLGRSLAAVLKRRGIAPICFDRASLDISDRAALERIFKQHRPTLLLNAAAHTKVDLCEDESEKANAINGHAVGAMAELSREYGTTLVHYSTDFVFDGKSRRPYRVDDPTNPLSAYGRSKLLGEKLLQENPPPRWLILRTAWAYGTGGMNFPRIIVERGRSGQPLKVVTDEVGSPTYTRDLATTTVDLLDGGASGLWHVSNAGAVSRFDFAKSILRIFGVQTELIPITTAEWLAIRPKQACRPAYSVLDVEPIARKLQKPMRSWEDGLQGFKEEVDARGGF
jgi:dTDP-4-dehydrorhamnose reductase